MWGTLNYFYAKFKTTLLLCKNQVDVLILQFVFILFQVSPSFPDFCELVTKLVNIKQQVALVSYVFHYFQVDDITCYFTSTLQFLISFFFLPFFFLIPVVLVEILRF